MKQYKTFSKEFEDDLRDFAKEAISRIQFIRDSTDDAHVKSLGFSMQQDLRHMLKLMAIAREYSGTLSKTIFLFDPDTSKYVKVSSQQKMKIATNLVENEYEAMRAQRPDDT